MNHADAGRQGGGGIARREGPARDLNRPLVRNVMAEQDAHQSRLAGPILAEDRQHLAGKKVEIDVAIRDQVAKGLGDAAQAEDRLRLRLMRPIDQSVGFGSVSSRFTVKAPFLICACRSITLALSSAGDLGIEGAQGCQLCATRLHAGIPSIVPRR